MNQFQQIVQLIKSGKNPQDLMIQMLPNNPMGQSLLKMIQSNDTQGIETIARNLCRQKGLDFDKDFTAFKQNLGL